MTGGIGAPGISVVAPIGRNELPRQRLIDVLGERWNRPLTVLRAGGGFGKSVALAEAIRDNESDPTGVDVYVACRTFDRDALQLARTVCSALDVPPPGPATTELDDIAAFVVAALAVRSPGRVCLVLDDVHRWTPDDGATLLVDRVLSLLPYNAHLVLSGRSIASRFVGPRKDGVAATVIDAQDLLFSRAELQQFAEIHGANVAQLSQCGGWPAMARLVLTAPPGTTVDYLMEEVVDDLPDRLRPALDAVLLARVADDALLQDRLGLDASVAELLDRVPLVAEARPGQVIAHDLWHEAGPRLTSPERRAELGRVISGWHREADRIDEAVAVAAGVGAHDEAAAAVLQAVAQSDAFLTQDRVGRWLSSFPAEERDRPELCLLRGVWARLRGEQGLGLEESRRALAGFLDVGDPTAVVAAVLEVGLVGWFTGDLETMLEAIAIADQMYADGVEGMAPLVGLARFGMADLSADPASALRHLDGVDPDSTPDALLALVMRAQASQCFLLGRGDRGATVAEEVARRWPMPETRGIAAIARWQSGDTSGVRDTWLELRSHRRGNHRDDFLHRVHVAIVDASFGIVADLDDLEASSGRTREVALVALAHMSAAVTEGDESSSAEHLDLLLRTVGSDDGLARNELRRFVTYPWVLSETWRASGADADLGPTLQRKLALAELLLQARRGTVEDWSLIGDGDAVFCAMPLRWSMELAATAAAAGDHRGPRLAEHLVDLAGHPARRVLRDLHDAGGPAAAGAAGVIRSLPIEPDRVTSVVTCGRLRVAGADPALLRRRKVRQLLELLVLRGSVAADEAATVLWGSGDPERIRPHLRSTLAAARKALEPLRGPGAAPFHLRRDGELLRLHRSEWLDVDAWAIEADLLASRRHFSSGRVALAVASARHAVERWSGPLFAELDDVPDLVAAVEAARRELLDGAALVAEWDHAHGEHESAASLAERVLATDPYEPRVHSVLMAALLATGRREDAHLAAVDCERAFAELGREPDGHVAGLVRRARLA